MWRRAYSPKTIDETHALLQALCFMPTLPSLPALYGALPEMLHVKRSEKSAIYEFYVFPFFIDTCKEKNRP